MTTLTIEFDDESISRIRQLADARHIPVDEMIRRLVQTITSSPLNLDDLPPLTRQSLGMLPPTSDDEVKKILDEHRMRKYGRP